jgi:2,4-dienoyl-CoA reductase-like NADH-dependent reductase (Old Yellow Enzyme family)
VNVNTDAFISRTRRELLDISRDEISKIIKLFVLSSQIASDLGFNIIQIHAAHGYLLSQMLNPVLNNRPDRYGDNRFAFNEQIIQEIRNKLPNIIIDIRLSVLSGLEDYGKEISTFRETIDYINKLDIDIISASNGYYDINKKYIYPLKELGHGVYIPIIAPFAQEFGDVLWNVAGNIWDLRKIDGSLPGNLTFSIGRALIADSMMVENQIQLEKDATIACTRCDLCHYYTNGMMHITCPVNSNLD